MRTRIYLSNDEWLEVEEYATGHYMVVGENITQKTETPERGLALGFTKWDNEVEDLDNGRSGGSSCFGISDHLKWNDVELTITEFKAASFGRLLEALEHVTIEPWCPDDI